MLALIGRGTFTRHLRKRRWTKARIANSELLNNHLTMRNKENQSPSLEDRTNELQHRTIAVANRGDHWILLSNEDQTMKFYRESTRTSKRLSVEALSWKFFVY